MSILVLLPARRRMGCEGLYAFLQSLCRQALPDAAAAAAATGHHLEWSGPQVFFVEMGLKQYSWSIDAWRKHEQKRKLKDCTGRTSLGSFPKIEAARPQISGASGPKV